MVGVYLYQISAVARCQAACFQLQDFSRILACQLESAQPEIAPILTSFIVMVSNSSIPDAPVLAWVKGWAFISGLPAHGQR